MRALVVDDNQSLAETVADILAARGFDVDVASSGAQALVAWRRHPADVIVVDVDLPDMGGLTVARRLAHRAGGCSVVIMSAQDQDRVLPLCRDLEATFLAKPFGASHLLAAVKAMLERRRLAASRAKRPARHLLATRVPKALLQRGRPRRGGR